MKKFLSLFLAAVMLCAVCCAAAEEDVHEQVEEAQAQVKGDIREDGCYVITIAVDPEDKGTWAADPMAQDESVVKLASSGTENGVFTAVYQPTGDGEVTVSLNHYDAHGACVEIQGFDLSVKDGKVAEVTGGHYFATPEEEDVDAYFSGEWLEKETQFTRLSVVKNPEGGWNVELTSPVSHGAWVIRATAYNDCSYNAFVYADGAKYDLTAEGTVSEQPAETGLWGTIRFDGTMENLFLIWYGMEASEGREISFEREAKE